MSLIKCPFRVLLIQHSHTHQKQLGAQYRAQGYVELQNSRQLALSWVALYPSNWTNIKEDKKDYF